MKSKILMLLLLLSVLVMQMSFAEQKTSSKQSLENEFVIDSQTNYTGSQVLELIAIVTEEAQEAIDRAFDEGYKQGVLSYAPETDYWKAEAEKYKAQYERQKKERMQFVFKGLAIGFAAGIGIAIPILNF